MFSGGDGGWMIFGWLWMILIGLVPILVLFALVKYLFNSQKSGESVKETPYRPRYSGRSLCPRGTYP